MPIAVGLEKGHPVEKRARPARRAKGAATPKLTTCREVVREVAGLLQYERRLLDMLKTGGASSEKRMYKFAKKRLGTHKRALRKREDIKDVYARMKAKAGKGAATEKATQSREIVREVAGLL